MARPADIKAQRDFSLGEVDITAKRRDDSLIVKASARQCSNWRILNSGAVKNRPGRRALFLETGRVDEVLMSPGNVFYLAFGAGYLRVYNAAGAKVFSTNFKAGGSTPIPWTSATVGLVVWDIYQLSIYICYGDGAPNNVPQVLTWDGVSQTSTWTLAAFAEYVNGNQKRTFFYRISPQNVTMQPSATTGAGITLTASANVFTPASVGTRIRWIGRQILITGYTDAKHVTATVEETLPNSETLTWAGTGINAKFSIGDTVIGSVSGANGIVTAVTTSTLTVVIINGIDFVWTGSIATTDVPTGPGGNAGAISASPTIISPQPIAIWDDEVMNPLRGYPQSCFVDQGRLGFCNFPSVPSGIGWSAFGNLVDLYVEFANAVVDDAIFEIAPAKSQVYYVVPGMESSEFVFCDNAIYYIPISAANPLKPGSVAFQALSAVGALQVEPRHAEQTILYVGAGGIKIMAVQAPGAYYRPYVVDDISELHGHLFNSTPIAIAVPSAQTQFEERYAYVVLANGTYVVAKYNIRNGLIEPGPEGKPHVGWSPHSGLGLVAWISARASDVIFTATYAPNGIPAVGVVEVLDDNFWLDALISVSNPAGALAPPIQKGPLWWLAGGSVFLFDGGRPMDVYNIDGSGFLIPQFIDGENLASPNLVAGQQWTSTLEPWIPQAPPSPSGEPRMYPRKVKRTAVSVQSSTGFLLQRLQSEKATPLTQAFGTAMSQILFPYYEEGEDATQAAPQRETTYWKRWLGRSYDPRIALVKNTPGPLMVIEFGNEVTV